MGIFYGIYDQQYVLFVVVCASEHEESIIQSTFIGKWLVMGTSFSDKPTLYIRK
jgi:hypothetical protein